MRRLSHTALSEWTSSFVLLVSASPHDVRVSRKTTTTKFDVGQTPLDTATSAHWSRARENATQRTTRRRQKNWSIFCFPCSVYVRHSCLTLKRHEAGDQSGGTTEATQEGEKTSKITLLQVFTYDSLKGKHAVYICTLCCRAEQGREKT